LNKTASVLSSQFGNIRRTYDLLWHNRTLRSIAR